MRVFETLHEMETDFYRWSATKILKNIDYKEFNLSLKKEPFSIQTILNLNRLRNEFIEIQEYMYCVGIRDYLKKYQ